MADKENVKSKNSFRDMMLIIIVVVICFALTLYGIVYLTGKVFNPEEKIEMQTNKYVNSTTDPDDGDVLTFALEDHSDNATTTPPKTEQKEPVTEQKKPVQVAPVIPKEEPKAPVAEQKKPAPAPKPVQTAKPIPKPVAEPQQPLTKSDLQGRYVVQLMASKSQSLAEQEAKKYQSACPDIHIRKVDLGADKGIWFRVRCGVTDSKTTADATKARLESTFGLKPQVVPNR